MIKSCKVCNSKFETKSFKALYCSNNCRYKQFYLNNIDKMKLKNEKYRVNNQDKIKQYTLDNKSRRKTYFKKYVVDNKDKRKEYYQNNIEVFKKQSKDYRKHNREELIKYSKEYRKNYTKEQIKEEKERLRQYRINNIGLVKSRMKQWGIDNANHKRNYNKKYYSENKDAIVKNARIYQRNRTKTDALYKLKRIIRNRVYCYLKLNNITKRNSTFDIVGCKPSQLKKHLEKQFKEGMTWDNHGEWHIDHIKPLASALDDEEVFKLCHYTNLQPLWAEDNLIKSCRY